MSSKLRGDNMKKVIALVMIFAMLAITACGTKDYYRASEKHSATEAVRMKESTVVMMDALKIVLGGFDEAAQQGQTNKVLFEKTYVDAAGNSVTEKVYDNSANMMTVFSDMKKADMVESLMPMVAKIYTQQPFSAKAPVSSGEVAMALVKQIPFMFTVAGMYGLGVAGIENAGQQITATLDNGSAFSVSGDASGANFVESFNPMGEGSASYNGNNPIINPEPSP